MESIAIFLLSFLASFRLFAVLRRRLKKNHHLPPGTSGWPLVGSLPAMLREKARGKWLVRETAGKDIWCVKLGSTHAVVINSPCLAREFLKKHDANFSTRPPTVVTGLTSHGYLSTAFTPMGEQWRKMRRIGKDLLCPARLRWQATARAEEADNLLRYLFHTCKVSGGAAVVDVRLVARYYCGSTVRRVMFGKRHLGSGARDGGPGPGPEEVEHIDAALSIDKLLYSFNISDLVPWLKWFDLDGHVKRWRQAMEVLNKYHDPIIDERVKGWRSGGDGRKKEPEDLLDVMVMLEDDDGKPLLTLDEIKSQMAEFIFASVDNPANIGEWALAEMLNQPDILKKAVAELDRVAGRDRLVQESDFNNLPYIQACCREALRMHPTAAFNLPHVALADDNVAGYFIPRGSHVLLGRVGLNRNPAVWEDPHRFDPDRHFKEGGRTDLAEPELRFVSFGTGRRGCMGAPLGMLITYMLVARLLQAFSWEPPPGVEAVDLEDEEKGFFKASRLLASIKPRLSFLDNI